MRAQGTQVTRNGAGPEAECSHSPSPSRTLSPQRPSTSVSSSSSSSTTSSATAAAAPAAALTERENVALLAERFKEFDVMEENLYLTDRKTSKEVKRMQCDCSLTKEEMMRGELGCGEDCINRLLMIEWYPSEISSKTHKPSKPVQCFHNLLVSPNDPSQIFPISWISFKTFIENMHISQNLSILFGLLISS